MTEEQQYQASRYIRQEMTRDEMEEFKKELEANPDLLREFNLRLLTAAALYGADKEDFIKRHKKKFDEERKEPVVKPVGKNPVFLWMAAAVVIGFLAIAVTFYLADEKEPRSGFSEEEYVTGFMLPLEKWSADGSITVKDSCKIDVIADPGLTVPQYEFNREVFSLYLPDREMYGESGVKRMVEREKVFFLLFENTWYGVDITEKEKREELAPVADPGF